MVRLLTDLRCEFSFFGVTAIAKQLDARLKSWRSPTAQKVEKLVADIIALADREGPVPKSPSKRVAKPGDPFLADRKVFRGRTPKDLAANHDRHLYGEQ
jgi:hypothetical protein